MSEGLTEDFFGGNNAFPSFQSFISFISFFRGKGRGRGRPRGRAGTIRGGSGTRGAATRGSGTRGAATRGSGTRGRPRGEIDYSVRHTKTWVIKTLRCKFLFHKIKVVFLGFLFFTYYIQHCFICRPSDCADGCWDRTGALALGHPNN